MQSIRKLIIVVSLACIVTCLNANQYSDKLVEIFEHEKQFTNAVKECKSSLNYDSPESLLLDFPDYFYGFNEKSKEWSQVVLIYNQYYESSCDYINPAKYLETISQLYEKELTNQQIQQIIEFYRTPLGKKLTDINIVVSSEIQIMMSKEASKANLSAAEIFKSKLLVLSQNASK